MTLRACTCSNTPGCQSDGKIPLNVRRQNFNASDTEPPSKSGDGGRDTGDLESFWDKLNSARDEALERAHWAFWAQSYHDNHVSSSRSKVSQVYSGS